MCGHCGFDLAAHKEQQHQGRLASARRFGLITYPIAAVVGLAMVGWIITWDIGTGWKVLWAVLLGPTAAALAFEYALSVIGFLLALVIVLAIIAGVGS